MMMIVTWLATGQRGRLPGGTDPCPATGHISGQQHCRQGECHDDDGDSDMASDWSPLNAASVLSR